jgi:hypothetical protein
MFIERFTCENCGQWHEFKGKTLDAVDTDLATHGWDGSVFSTCFNSLGGRVGTCPECSKGFAAIETIAAREIAQAQDC